MTYDENISSVFLEMVSVCQVLNRGSWIKPMFWPEELCRHQAAAQSGWAIPLCFPLVKWITIQHDSTDLRVGFIEARVKHTDFDPITCENTHQPEYRKDEQNDRMPRRGLGISNLLPWLFCRPQGYDHWRRVFFGPCGWWQCCAEWRDAASGVDWGLISGTARAASQADDVLIQPLSFMSWCQWMPGAAESFGSLKQRRKRRSTLLFVNKHHQYMLKYVHVNVAFAGEAHTVSVKFSAEVELFWRWLPLTLSKKSVIILLCMVWYWNDRFTVGNTLWWNPGDLFMFGLFATALGKDHENSNRTRATTRTNLPKIAKHERNTIA